MASENVGPIKNNIEVDRELINKLANDKDSSGKDLNWTKKYANSNTSWEAKIGGRDASKIQLEDGTITKMTNDAKGNVVEINEKPDGTISASIRNGSKSITFKIKKRLYNTNRNRKDANRDRIRRGKESPNRRKNRFESTLERMKERVAQTVTMVEGLKEKKEAAQSKNKRLKARRKKMQGKAGWLDYAKTFMTRRIENTGEKSSEKKKPSKTKELLKKAGKLLGKFLKGILALFMKMFKAYRQRKSPKEELLDVLSDLLKTSWKVTKELSKSMFKGLLRLKSVKKNTTKSTGKANDLSLGDKLKAAFQSLKKEVNAPGASKKNSKQMAGSIYEQVYGAGSLKKNKGNLQKMKLQFFMKEIRDLQKEKQQKTGKAHTKKVKTSLGTGVFWSAFPEITKEVTKTASSIITTKTTKTKRNSGPRRG